MNNAKFTRKLKKRTRADKAKGWVFALSRVIYRDPSDDFEDLGGVVFFTVFVSFLLSLLFIGAFGLTFMWPLCLAPVTYGVVNQLHYWYLNYLAYTDPLRDLEENPCSIYAPSGTVFTTRDTARSAKKMLSYDLDQEIMIKFVGSLADYTEQVSAYQEITSVLQEIEKRTKGIESDDNLENKDLVAELKEKQEELRAQISTAHHAICNAEKYHTQIDQSYRKARQQEKDKLKMQEAITKAQNVSEKISVTQSGHIDGLVAVVEAARELEKQSRVQGHM